MIYSVRANDERFKTVNFRPGFNLLLADTTEGSTNRDTRNGVGKTLLLDVIHFCLGGSAPTGGGLASPELIGWEFTIDLDLLGARTSVTRSLTMPRVIKVDGDFTTWPVEPTWDAELASFRLTNDEWKQTLGSGWFGLPAELGSYAYKPSFRLLFPYFARVHSGAHQSPFKTFDRMPEWQKQVAITYLLGLSWEHAARFQQAKDDRQTLRTLRRAIERGTFGDPGETLGRLRARRVQIDAQISAFEQQLRSFEVHPEYEQITSEANELTGRIHSLVNARVVRGRTLAMYRDQAEIETGPDPTDVAELFEQAGIELPDSTRRTLDASMAFHVDVVSNRREFLRDEITAMEDEDRRSLVEVEELTAQRARLLRIIESKHALDELHELNRHMADLRSQRGDLESQINRISDIDDRQTALGISLQALVRDAGREVAEREDSLDAAIEIFAGNTAELYGISGELVVDVGENGFSFDVHIPRSGSHGVNNMKIFAFDLVLAQRWASQERSPGVLFHDSEIFDGVDERQVGAALQLAAKEADENGFQYFCSLNSDDMPTADLLGGMTPDPVLRLTDASEDGGLFGMRF